MALDDTASTGNSVADDFLNEAPPPSEDKNPPVDTGNAAANDFINTPTPKVKESGEEKQPLTAAQKARLKAFPSGPTIGDEPVNALHETASGLYHSVVGGYKGLATLATSGGDADKAAQAVRDEQAKTYRAPVTPQAAPQPGTAAYAVQREQERYYQAHPGERPTAPTVWQDPGAALGEFAERHGARPALSAIATAVPTAVESMVAPGRGGLAGVAEAAAPEAAAAAGGARSIGAAEAATPGLENTPKDFQQAHAAAASSGPINPTVAARHVQAESLPVPIRLRAGQATGDAQQFSDEANMRADPDTQGVLTNDDKLQNDKLVANLETARREATPEVVQRDNVEHGQQAVDDVKAMDNARMDDISAKYKKLADANGGKMPIDGRAWVDSADAQLAEESRDIFLPENVRKLMDRVRGSGEMTFGQFENYRSILADEGRAAEGSARRSIAIVRNALENVPLSEGAANLKGLADDARQAAASRFEDIERNPGYEAVVNDNVKMVGGRHVVGKPSPLADSFISKYANGNGGTASRANVIGLKGLMQNYPTFSDAIEGATLNNLRKSAGINSAGDYGDFKAASYNAARDTIEPKADLLLKPETAKLTRDIGDVARNIKTQPPGGFVNRSGTAIVQQRMAAEPVPGMARQVAGKVAGMGAEAATQTVLGPVVGTGARVLGNVVMRGRAAAREAAAAQSIKDAKLKFAQDATAPGAGLNYKP
jgi:hypothetical protein